MQMNPLRPLELAELGKRIDERVRIATHAERAAGSHVPFRRNSAIAQVCLGCGRQAGDRAALRQRICFIVGHVRRMHDAPATVDVCMLQQPINGSHAAPRDAFVDFLRLLGRVNVQRCIGRPETYDFS